MNLEMHLGPDLRSNQVNCIVVGGMMPGKHSFDASLVDTETQ